jgi:Skp family chaperone for outer membrane proteins
MKRIKFILLALVAMVMANVSVEAATIGYADFGKVLTEYKYAKNAYKDIDNKIILSIPLIGYPSIMISELLSK